MVMLEAQNSEIQLAKTKSEQKSVKKIWVVVTCDEWREWWWHYDDDVFSVLWPSHRAPSRGGRHHVLSNLLYHDEIRLCVGYAFPFFSRFGDSFPPFLDSSSSLSHFSLRMESWNEPTKKIDLLNPKAMRQRGRIPPNCWRFWKTSPEFPKLFNAMWYRPRLKTPRKMQANGISDHYLW